MGLLLTLCGVLLADKIAFSTSTSSTSTSRHKNLEARITNGEEASLNQFPYQVSITLSSSYLVFRKKTWNCGGSILSSNWILTAAHCVQE